VNARAWGRLMRIDGRIYTAGDLLAGGQSSRAEWLARAIIALIHHPFLPNSAAPTLRPFRAPRPEPRRRRGATTARRRGHHCHCQLLALLLCVYVEFTSCAGVRVCEYEYASSVTGIERRLLLSRTSLSAPPHRTASSFGTSEHADVIIRDSSIDSSLIGHPQHYRRTAAGTRRSQH
jgi:hypothetical protein